LGGGRYDWTQVKTAFAGFPLRDQDITTINDEQFSPRVGVSYQPWTWLSLYGNYIESFGANNGRSGSGQPLEPESATQYEVGLKAEFFDGRLSSSLAFYHLTKENVLTGNPSTPDPFDVAAIGERRVAGESSSISPVR
jgi:iron complex outermembrane receptor protein